MPKMYKCIIVIELHIPDAQKIVKMVIYTRITNIFVIGYN